MPIVYLIRVFGLFFESNILGIEGIGVFKCLGKYPWMFRRFRDVKNRRKVEMQVRRPWGAVPSIAPQDSLCHRSSGRHAS